MTPKWSFITLASGARQLVVHDALEIYEATRWVETNKKILRLTMLYLGSYESRLTPHTNIGASADGAEMITFLAPPFR